MEFSEIIKTGKEAGRESHVPAITIDKGHKSGRDIEALLGEKTQYELYEIVYRTER